MISRAIPKRNSYQEMCAQKKNNEKKKNLGNLMKYIIKYNPIQKVWSVV